ncbi:putative alpha-ketoglutarate-dependent sulfonate dioxygenase [Eremomyces bilateralis CBS 781.70]|uniref:Alpha-ketoglutarate-dependent sulfonate dioxygenase n=1 Tax=Eremomyces bilateralis CBS 781.70 TaxID=1392243 RepID=A0A6G1GA13_9PEZI|nr:putative alpha-ketoglutarate-dependent sulfonate dioxygenase [Eremomyces bilateralis CBS 781.70]KAF1814741.1 putative alpha-ketoglutarate-dependent sulfonate dioxygenase [Eremomyces bilateralis CBS 781.70]
MVQNTITPALLAYSPPDPPLKEFTPAKDRAFFADTEKRSLLSAASAAEDLTPYIGTELKGIQLSQLTDQQKDELALLVAERGVVLLRDQDITLEQQHALAAHYGIQDRDPNQQDPNHVTIIGRGGNIRAHGHSGGEYHADHSFEVNPPSYTLLRLVKTPPYGGDTIFTSQTALFDKLSPTFQKAFEGLHGIHSSDRAYVASINGGGSPHRAPIATAHPLVRTHPVTLLKVLNYNPTFIERIEELNGQESHHILAFLREHLLQANDLTVRWKWTPGSVAFWDNRSVVHRAIPGGYDVTLREGKRTAVYGERPFWDPERSESLSQRLERLGANGHAIGTANGHENGKSEGLGANGAF